MKNVPTLIRFLTCGCITTGIDFVLYLYMMNLGNPAYVSKPLSVLVATVISFFLNRRWTFRFEKETDWKLVLRFACSQAANIGVNATVNYLTLLAVGNMYFAFVCATGCGVIVNFTLQKYVVFREKKAQSSSI